MINNDIKIASIKVGSKANDLNRVTYARKVYIKEMAVPIIITAFYYSLGFDRFFNTSLKIIF